MRGSELSRTMRTRRGQCALVLFDCIAHSLRAALDTSVSQSDTEQKAADSRDPSGSAHSFSSNSLHTL